MSDLHIFYRISDNGYKYKVKAEYITKENCLRNALETFTGENTFFHIYVDDVIQETEKMIERLTKNRPRTDIVKLNIKSNAKSFRRTFEDACELEDETMIYFLEDDYIHVPTSEKYLIEALTENYTEYVTLYDHADKYSDNKFVNQECKYIGEKSYVFKTKSHHWKTTNSTTMTFASKVKVLKRDKYIFWKHTTTNHPYDFNIFLDLKGNGVLLSSPIPSLSTHGEIEFMAPFINWKEYAEK